jgi:hypothetical protein
VPHRQPILRDIVAPNRPAEYLGWLVALLKGLLVSSAAA